MALIEKISNIANAIRAKAGITNLMTLDDMALAINNLNVSNYTVTEKTFVVAEPTQTLSLDIDYTPKYIILSAINNVNYNEYNAFYGGYIDLKNGYKQSVYRQNRYGTMMAEKQITYTDGVITLSDVWFTENNLLAVICR